VEDLHQHLRDADRGQRQAGPGVVQRMTLVLESQLLQRRGFETWSATPEEAAAMPRSNAATLAAKEVLAMQHCVCLRLV
jgi:hypothetical protein